MTFELNAAMLTDVGCEREVNEDAGVIVRPTDPEILKRRGVLAIVADGMGGHAAGEVASRIAVEAVHRSYYASRGDIYAALKTALEYANQEILQEAQRDSRRIGMGTTCVALALCASDAYVASVGDSRLYLIRGGRIYQMTTDDSAVSQLVKDGSLARDDARQHKDRNVILRALGTHDSVEISVWHQPFPVREHDVLVLCSDGLSDLVDDTEILAAAAGQHEADACRALIDLARSRGGYDNITVAVLRLASAAATGVSVPVTRELKATS